MKILMKSINLFLFGIYIETCKRSFDKTVDRRIARGRSLSSKALSAKSNRCCRLYNKFKELERDLNFEIIQKAALKHI